MTSHVRTHNPRTSLIDAEWDWIANRLVERDGQWTVSSVINPSLARVSYSPLMALPLLNRLPARAVEAEPIAPSLGSNDDATGVPRRRWQRGLAVCITLTLGLTGGVLWQRAGNETRAPLSAAPTTAPAPAPAIASARPNFVERAPMAEAVSAVPVGAAPPSPRHALERPPRPRPRPARLPAAPRRTPTTDNPY